MSAHLLSASVARRQNAVTSLASRLTIALAIALAIAVALSICATYSYAEGSPQRVAELPGQIVAVDSDSDGGGRDNRLESVTVTARRRNENAQDVPIPIAALSGDALESRGRFRLEDLNEQLPSTNVQFVNPRNTSIAVRGLGNNPANDSLEGSVGVYLDNVYLGRPGMASFDLIDVDQISLLRGPQGTLFGKNTTAGVLNISTRQPTFTPEGSVEGSFGRYGNSSQYQVRGSYSGPLSDTLAGRLSVAKTYKDGYINDLTDGRKLDGSSRQSFRGQLLYKPSENFSLRVIGDYNQENSRCCIPVLYNPGPNNGALYYSKVASINGKVVYDPDYRSVTINDPQFMHVRQGGGSVEANWKVGDYTLTSITAYRNWWFLPVNDVDYTSVSALPNAGQKDDDEQISEEFRVASPVGKPIEWVAGLYYFYQYQSNLQFNQYGPAAIFYGSPILANGYSQTRAHLHTDSYSAFGQATWHIADAWDLTAGLRDTKEKKSAAVIRDPGIGSAGFQAAFAGRNLGVLSIDDNNVSALLSLGYKVTDGVLAYASVSHGAKAGGINPAIPAAGLTTKSLFVTPEKATDAELGFKSTLFDQRLTLNANLFWTRVVDYQTTVLEQNSVGQYQQTLSNIGLVRTQGVETEITAVPFAGLTVGLTASYNDAIYKEYKNAPCSAESQAAGKTTCDLSGQQVVGAPKWIINPHLAYTHALTGSLTGYAGTDYAWKSSFFGSADNSQYGKVDAYGLLNVRAGITGKLGTDTWDASIWSTNATDKRYVVGGVGLATYRSYYEFPGEPRVIGATFRLSF